MKKRIIFSFFGIFSFFLSDAQVGTQANKGPQYKDGENMDSILIQNGSFEDNPHQGGISDFGIRRWFDCGRVNFPDATPPDIHPKDFWENTTPSSHGKTYLGMVTRENESWEAVSQRLEVPLQVGKCYSLSIELAKSPKYVSPVATNANGVRQNSAAKNFTTPIVLRVWGGSGHCNDKQLLSESIPINHPDWKTYKFSFEPNFQHRYIVLEAFYKTPTLMPYNGHLLIDNLSNIAVFDCPKEPLIAYAYPQVDQKKAAIPAHKRKKKKPKKKKETTSSKKDVAAVVTSPSNTDQPKRTKAKILKELDKSTLKKGQIINIESLYFEADTSSINEDSYAVLNEVFDFLNENSGVFVEIGGHTNGIPPHSFCDKLSTARAKEVASYLIRKGIPTNRVTFKGYGKRKQIASNRTKNGRKKNQRVEVKILDVGG